ncbi:hypothetical protein TNCV_3685221 [Trichonephila clavipes]|nr:hypothetical protein TNCV_3685221 [Trichonephila clavipes]
MRIILKDEEPVCQHPCRLAFRKTTSNQRLTSRRNGERITRTTRILRNDAKRTSKPCSLKIDRRITEEKSLLYKEGDLVAIKEPNFLSWTETKTKVLRPLQTYKVTKVNSRIGMKWKRLVSTMDRTQPPPQLI